MKARDLEAVFRYVVGPEVVEAAVADLSDRPTVLIAGGPLTGKSTLAKLVASRLGGPLLSAGALVRRRAEASGRSVIQATLDLPRDDHVRLDFAMARSIARGEARVYEGRMVAHIGAWLRTRGRRGLVIVVLECPLDVRARRFGARDGGDLPAEALSAAVAAREATDRRALEEVYGFDFASPTRSDLLLDSSRASPEELLEEVLARVAPA